MTPPPARPVRPRTRPGRLRFLDLWVQQLAPLHVGERVVDVGFGERPDTLLELAAAVRAVRPGLEVVGVERRPASAVEGVTVVQGDFETVAAMRQVTLVRAMNVLRGYREDEVALIRHALRSPLAPGGQLLEGSTDTEGHVTVCHLEGALHGLLFHTDFSRGFSPWLFRDWLPRDLRRSARPGTPIFELFTAWEAAAPTGRPPRERFLESIDRVEGLTATAWEREHGFVRSAAPL
jgi:hypothetical protein